MRKQASIITLPIWLLAASCAEQPVVNRPAGESGQSAEYAADDTGRNVRDRDGGTITPLDQSTNPDDEKITRELRQSITNDSSLSMNAHNVKVVTNDGVVTLRGPVRNDDERAIIERKAREVPGVARVDNQLEVSRQ